jgi:hypothetical protein
MDAIAEIKRLYYAATKATIRQDLERAIDLLKSLSSEEERERAAVYMDGLVQMRSEWAQASRGGVTNPHPSGPRPSVSARPGATPRRYSDRSKASSRRSR